MPFIRVTITCSVAIPEDSRVKEPKLYFQLQCYEKVS